MCLQNALAAYCFSELYDDVPIEDAPYFSALYGPARHAIVVRDLNTVREQLANLEDCPDDLYLIEVTQMPLMTAYFQPKNLNGRCGASI